uniref:Uncharacterized protein n=1 Tax=Arundo donax TaxID=35708 RepID=A0A0A8XQY4_ARUDO
MKWISPSSLGSATYLSIRPPLAPPGSINSLPP